MSVSVILWRNKTDRIYIYIYIYRFITGIGSCGYGSQEVPQSAVCKLEHQESQCYNSVQTQRPENLGTDGVSPSLSLKVKCPNSSVQEQEKIDVSAEEKRVNLSFLRLFVLFGPSVDWMMATHFREDDLLYSIYYFN